MTTSTDSGKRIVVAIDGFSSSGKSTMARRLAARVGYRYIDSGAMYRAVALYALEHGMATEGGELQREAIVASLPQIKIDFKPQPDGTQHTLLNGADVETEIRQLRVSQVVSPVAAIPQVRRALVSMQQALGRDKGIVMDGRDIGTTVFPDAELKIFLTASAHERAIRRLAQNRERGVGSLDFDEVLADIERRDELDSSRDTAPLRAADDAVQLDSTSQTIAQIVDSICDLAKKRMGAL